MNHLMMAATLAIASGLASGAAAQSTKASDLSKQLSNPLANLISVPIKLDYNSGFASGNGDQTTMTVQPVIPISINNDWNVISRTIIPVVFQDGVVPGLGHQSGFGNTTQSLFFSPKAPTKGGVIWGVGPMFQLPTATDRIAPADWGVGITGVVLKQTGGLTIGGLASHIGSVSNGELGNKFSATYLQPFISYSTASGTSYTLNTESTYEWNSKEWSVPINATVGQMVKFGKQPVQLTAGVRYWADSPAGGPDDWGGRLQMTFLFPK
ncbi:transporter [Roseovarius sp. M141]|nr:transporter [Roseovarius sp. M141]